MDDNQTFCSDVGWDPLKGHDGTCASFFSNTSLSRIKIPFKSELEVKKGQGSHLFRINDIHDDTALMIFNITPNSIIRFPEKKERNRNALLTFVPNQT